MNRKTIYFFAYLGLFVAFLFVIQSLNTTGNVVLTKNPAKVSNEYFSVAIDSISDNGGKVSYTLTDFSGKSGLYQVRINGFDGGSVSILKEQEVALEGNGIGKYSISFYNPGYDQISLEVSNGYFKDQVFKNVGKSSITGNVTSEDGMQKSAIVLFIILLFLVLIYIIRLVVRRYGRIHSKKTYSRKLIPLRLD